MGIQFVGGASAGKAGAVSANSTIALNSGLSGGIASSVSAGDLVLALFVTGTSSDRTLSITDGTNPYTLIGSELYKAGSNYSVNFRLCYKFMPSSPDTATTFGPTGSNNDGGASAVYVWRGVDPNTPLDVTAVQGTNTSDPDPLSITPSTPGAIIIVAGGSGFVGSATFTASDLSNFVTVVGPDTNDGVLGIGSYTWTSGAFDPGVFSSGDVDNTCGSAHTVIALRPYEGKSPPAIRPNRRAQHLLMR